MARLKKTKSELKAERLYKKYLQQPKKKKKVVKKQTKKERNLTPKQKYKVYLKSAHWKQLRLKILLRDNYKCRLCGNSSKLEVHHLTYNNKGKENLDDLITVCSKCHRDIHNIR